MLIATIVIAVTVLVLFGLWKGRRLKEFLQNRSLVPWGMPNKHFAKQSLEQSTTSLSPRLTYVLGGLGLYFGSFFLLWRLATKSTWIVFVGKSAFTFNSVIAVIVISTGLCVSTYAIWFIFAELYAYSGFIAQIDKYHSRRADYSFVLLLLSVLTQLTWLAGLTIALFIPMSSHFYVGMLVLSAALWFFLMLFTLSERTKIRFAVLLTHFAANTAGVMAIALTISNIAQPFQNVWGTVQFRLTSGTKPEVSYHFTRSYPSSIRLSLDKVESSGKLKPKNAFSKQYPITDAFEGSYQTVTINKWIKFENRAEMKFSDTGYMKIPVRVSPGKYLFTLFFSIDSKKYFMKEVVTVSDGSLDFTKDILQSGL